MRGVMIEVRSLSPKGKTLQPQMHPAIRQVRKPRNEINVRIVMLSASEWGWYRGGEKYQNALAEAMPSSAVIRQRQGRTASILAMAVVK